MRCVHSSSQSSPHNAPVVVEHERRKRLFWKGRRTNGAALPPGQPARARCPHALCACTRRARGQHA
eukprot:4340043-Prymnesium_polylepis.1